MVSVKSEDVKTLVIGVNPDPAQIKYNSVHLSKADWWKEPV